MAPISIAACEFHLLVSIYPYPTKASLSRDRTLWLEFVPQSAPWTRFRWVMHVKLLSATSWARKPFGPGSGSQQSICSTCSSCLANLASKSVKVQQFLSFDSLSTTSSIRRSALGFISRLWPHAMRIEGRVLVELKATRLRIGWVKSQDNACGHLPERRKILSNQYSIGSFLHEAENDPNTHIGAQWRQQNLESVRTRYIEREQLAERRLGQGDSRCHTASAESIIVKSRRPGRG